MKQKRWLDQVGLRLSRQALRVLKERGILVQAAVRLEHQHLAQRYVVRGLESGGAVGELGRYVIFAQEDGQPLEWLHAVEAIEVNGLHAVVVAPVLVRVEMLGKGQTYELLITQHTVKSYLFAIARNGYIDLLRSAARHTQLDETVSDTRISPQTQMELSAEVRAVLAALQQVPEMDRTVLLMLSYTIEKLTTSP